MGLFLIFFGMVLILTPAIIASKDGVNADYDHIQWLMNKPLEDIHLIQFAAKSGIMFLGIGGVVFYLT